MSDVAPAPTYAVDAGDVARDREAVLAVWRGNLGDDARMQAKFDWFYARCPYGPPVLMLLRARDGEALVGVAAAGARRMQEGGRTFEAGVLVDLAVAAEHRSLGPALMLQSAVAEAGVQRFGFLYGFPNPKAAPVFKRVGYARLGDIVRHARVLRHAGYAQRRLPPLLARPAGAVLDVLDTLKSWWRRRGDARLRWHWRELSDLRFSELWERSPHGTSVATVRDGAFTRWRFDENPLAKTRFLIVEDARGELLAWFACEADGNLLHVRDFWSGHGDAGIVRAHVDVLLRAARHGGHAAVSLEFAGSAGAFAGWAACGFVERSRRPVFGKWADGRPVEGTTLHLTSADEDE